MFNMFQIESLLVTAQQVQENTQAEPILSKVVRFTKESLSDDLYCHLNPSSRSWHWKEDVFCEECGWLFLPSFAKEFCRSFIWIIQECHGWSPSLPNHGYVCTSILLARTRQSYWGAGQVLLKLSNQSTPPVAPLHPWVWPTKPWEHVHINFAGPFWGECSYIAVDTLQMAGSGRDAKYFYGKDPILPWDNFSTHGLPCQVVSDNGPQFRLAEFADFMRRNGIKHIFCFPYHPFSNGLVERFVQTFMNAMKAGEMVVHYMPSAMPFVLHTNLLDSFK